LLTTFSFAPCPADLPPDLIIETIREVVSDLKQGKSPRKKKDDIIRLISNQAERLDLIEQLIMAHYLDRAVLYLDDRWRNERFLHECLIEKKFTPSESLAYQHILSSGADTLVSDIRKGKGVGGGLKDVEGTIDKVDQELRQTEKDLQSVFKEASPQGLEIVRRLGFKAEKIAGKVLNIQQAVNKPRSN
jgi:hypothetical protein